MAFAFVPQKVSYYVHKDIDLFFLFLLQKDFDILVIYSYLSTLYIEKKCKKYFY